MNSTSVWVALGIFLLTCAFNAGGVWYIMTNHLPHLTQSIKDIRDDLSEVKTDIAFLKGKAEGSK